MVNLIMINWNCSIGYLNGMQSSISNNHTFREVRRKAKIELVVRCGSGWIVDRAGVINNLVRPSLLWSEHTQPQLSSLSSHPWSAGAEETDQKLVHADQFTLSSTLRMKWHKLAIWSHYLPLLHNLTKGLSNQKMFALSCIMLGPSPDIRKLQSAGCRMVF